MSVFNYKFKDLVEVESLNKTLDELYSATHIPAAIVDLDGNLLTTAGRQRICREFHRKNPESKKACIQSDIYTRAEQLAGKPYVTFACPHGLIDSCCPVIVDGHHLANVCAGPMLPAELTDEIRDRFRRQARRFGFDEDAYLEALAEVPVFPVEKHQAILAFLANFVQQIAQTGLPNAGSLTRATTDDESEVKFRALIETTGTGYIVCDEKGTLLDANQNTVSLAGYQHLAEIVGRNVLEWTAGQDSDRIKEALRRCFNEGPVRNLEMDWVRPDGSIIPIEVNATAVTLHGKKNCLAMIQDISHHKLVENALKRSEAQLAESQNVAKLGSWDVNLLSGALTWSVETFRLFDKEPQDFTPTFAEFARMIHPDDLDTMQSNFDKALENGANPYHVDIRIINDSGREWVMEAFGEVKRDIKGQAVSVFGTAQDISERKRVEDALTKAKEEWEKTFDAMADILTIQSKDMKIIRANKAAHDFFEVEPGGLAGRYCYEVFRGENQPCAHCPELETIADCRAHSGNIKHEKLGKSFHVSSSPVFDENGELKYLVHVAKDITVQKKLEEDLFQSHKMEAIGTLAGGIAHDFNNILSAIIGYSELTLMDLPEKTPSRENIRQIYKAGNRAKELVKQILSFSRKNQRKLAPFEPSSIIKEALKLMRASLPTSIAIIDEIDPECGKILADPTNLHQILVNLCTNALHAIENEKGEIRIKLSAESLTSKEIEGHLSVTPGRFVVLSVSDTGCGIDEFTMQRIFEPYFTTKSPGKGTGMGLSVVHGIVKNSGGMIKVTSEPGCGATFKLYFPAMTGGVNKPNGLSEGDVPLPRGIERILVIDDEDAIVDMEQAVLEILGYTVISKTNSMEALEEFRRTPEDFDLIITDQTMPFLTGVELAKEAMVIKPTVPVILCTGYSSVVTEEEALEIGIKSYAKKPVDVKSFAMMVRNVLDDR